MVFAIFHSIFLVNKRSKEDLMPTSNAFYDLSYRLGTFLILLLKLQFFWLLTLLKGGIIFGFFPATATIFQVFLLMFLNPFQTLAMVVSSILTSALVFWCPLFCFLAIPLFLFPIGFFTFQAMQRGENLVRNKTCTK